MTLTLLEENMCTGVVKFYGIPFGFQKVTYTFMTLTLLEENMFTGVVNFMAFPSGFRK